MDAGSPAAQGVADIESILVVPRARYGETGTDRVAGPQQRAEVGAAPRRVVGAPEVIMRWRLSAAAPVHRRECWLRADIGLRFRAAPLPWGEAGGDRGGAGRH